MNNGIFGFPQSGAVPGFIQGDLDILSNEQLVTSAPNIRMRRGKKVTAAELIGRLAWLAVNGNSIETDFGDIVGRVSDPTGGSEDLDIVLRTMFAGTKAERFFFNGGMNARGLVDQGDGTVNVKGLYINNANALGVATVISAAVHSPVAGDNGVTFIYTNAGGCAVTMPATGTLPNGWNIGVVNQSAGIVAFTRAGADTLISKGTALNTLNLPSIGDGGSLILDLANTRFFFLGRRSNRAADAAYVLNSLISQNHNLGVIPDQWNVFIVNTIVNLGYNPGDVVDPSTFASAAAASGYSTIPLAATIDIYMGAAGMAIPNKGTFATAVITVADWNVRCISSVVN